MLLSKGNQELVGKESGNGTYGTLERNLAKSHFKILSKIAHFIQKIFITFLQKPSPSSAILNMPSTPFKVRSKKGILFTIFFLGLLTGGLVAQNLAQQLQTILTNRQLMGMSVTVVAHDSIIFSQGFGTADWGRGIAVTDSTQYRIASISKAVAATALMKLYEQGLFHLDDDVSSYLGFVLRNPYFPDAPITFRMLLSHTSSIQDGTGYGPFSTASFAADPPPPLSSMMVVGGPYFTANMFRSEPPGTFFTYSNVNFGIVGTLVERISGERFDVYCRQYILEPLGLTGSFNVQDLTNLDNLAVLYRKIGGVWTPQVDNYLGIMPPPRNLSVYPIGSNAFIFGPQGGLRISAHHLAKYMLMHLNNGILDGVRILQDSTATLMHTPQWTFDGTNGDNYYGLFRQWGLGFQITTNAPGGDIVFPDLPLIGHAGEAYGLISDMYFDTLRKIGIIFITNGCGNGYTTDASSAFYTVENAVFEAVYQNVLAPIVTTMATETPGRIGFSPNPAGDYLRLQLPAIAAIATLQILNLQGQVVCRQIMNTADSTVNLTGLPAGAYFMFLKNGQSVQVEKLIKL